MTKLEKIEQEISALSNEEIRKLANWFAEFQADLWDREIARDAAEGRLDKLAEEALNEHRAGRTLSLNHFASSGFWKLFNALPADIQTAARGQFDLLKSNPRHPSLQFKPAGRYWSARVNLSYRALAAETAGDCVWFWIGPHDEYIRIIRRG